MEQSPSHPASPAKPVDFSAEFKRHYRSLWVVAVGVVGDAADADDVVQEAMIVGLRKAESFASGTSFRAWMGEIVRNVGRNRLRKRRGESRRFGRGGDVHAIEVESKPDAGRAATAYGQLLPDQGAFDDRMLSAIAKLEPVARACLLLRCVEGRGYEEIAEFLGIPEGTAMSHVFRCRRTLADLLASDSDVRR
jgi:RNA polymerase sigma-70 factor (ECF subfamily)